MIAPRLIIDLDKIYHNACVLVERLGNRGISVTGVTKAMLGRADVAETLVSAGVKRLGDSRIENIETMHLGLVHAPITLIRSPMLSQVSRVVRHVDFSCNTENRVIKALSVEAEKIGLTHGIILMVELGDLREGVMPEDLMDMVKATLELPGIVLEGIGTNLACRSGVSPDEANMAKLSDLARRVESHIGRPLRIVSGGNSANLEWALGDSSIGRINDLRLGEAILLGCETLHRKPIEGLHGDAITLHAEVIESKIKPSKPIGTIAQTAFGEAPEVEDRGLVAQAILAVGQQDLDPTGLEGPAGTSVQGASSDHLIVETQGKALPVGQEVSFKLNYSALMRTMTSPFVAKVVRQSLPSRKGGLAAALK